MLIKIYNADTTPMHIKLNRFEKEKEKKESWLHPEVKTQASNPLGLELAYLFLTQPQSLSMVHGLARGLGVGSVEVGGKERQGVSCSLQSVSLLC